jgi:hypothetical protein
MANALNREIKAGESVVLKDILKPEFSTLEWRTVKAIAGFGMLSYTVGTALLVEFKDGERTRLDGYDIDVEETIRLQDERSSNGTRS